MAPSTLLLLRHGPAKDPLPGQRDADRPLKKSGRRLVQELGEAMGDLGWTPDLALCSPYCRAVETLEALSKGWGAAIQVELLDELVPHGDLDHAEAELRVRMAERPLGTRLLVVSHLPLAELLVQRLSARFIGLPPAHGVAIDWDGAHFRYHGRIQPAPPFLERG